MKEGKKKCLQCCTHSLIDRSSVESTAMSTQEEKTSEQKQEQKAPFEFTRGKKQNIKHLVVGYCGLAVRLWD